ncbi:ATP-binding protein [Nesterenkonia muleiensis]|uniref:ATP-binding protein n=1 Tax=Nesterenkonia muleiensis TaxID=2282648 RepID=UPI001EE410B8|nr:AAA family ATPase [Nesterenkonia muleiensis]
MRRTVDDELDELFPSTPAIALDGPKFVGKTTTAHQRVKNVLALDNPATRELVGADPFDAIFNEPTPTLIDEWQNVPAVWDAVRRAVDAAPTREGKYLLTGSASPSPGTTAHSGAGRIIRMRMRPMTLSERGVSEPVVSLRKLLYEPPASLSGRSTLTLRDYIQELCRSGFPDIRSSPERNRRKDLSSYLHNIVDRDIPELGETVRRREVLLDWLRSYALSSATTASYKTIIDQATPGDSDPPARDTLDKYRDLLRQIWIVDPVDAWHPRGIPIDRLYTGPKHHLADPALAAQLLQLTPEKLLRGQHGINPPRGSLLGNFFESFATLCIRVAAQAVEAEVRHMRTRNGDHEVDLIIEGHDESLVAIEIKATAVPENKDFKHLKWLRAQLGARLTDALLITTGQGAYRREDGIGVVPLAMLGP